MSDVYPEEKEKPVTANKSHDDPDVPQEWYERWRRRVLCWISENHDDGRDKIDNEAVEHQYMGNPSLHVAEFAGGRNLYCKSPDRHGDFVCTAKLPDCCSL